jgi:DNA invertase Pin-like site-specific DNA recombinase
MIAFMAASAQAQAEATKEAQKAGIAHAKQKENLYRGRKPSFDRIQFDVVVDLIGKGMGVSEIAKVSTLSRQTIYRIKDDVAGSEKSFVVW